MGDNSSRSKALTWWRNLSEAGQKLAISKWRNVTSDSKRDWPFELIIMSSSTIEQIWLELDKAE